MRCLSCHKLSMTTFCKTCQDRLLKPTVTKRTINGLDVYSFFKYQHIQDLLLTKHTPQGFKIYRALAKLSFSIFIDNFIENDPRDIYIVGIDENIKSGYSHVALLTHEMSHNKYVKVLHGKLMAKNNVNYSGKNLQYRLENPRDFSYSGPKSIEVILVDDIVTTGTTLNEAKQLLEKYEINTIFALTLADAKA